MPGDSRKCFSSPPPPPPTSSTQCFPPSRPKELALVVRVAETPVLGQWWHSSPSIVSYREKENFSKIKFLKLLLLGLQMRQKTSKSTTK